MRSFLVAAFLLSLAFPLRLVADGATGKTDQPLSHLDLSGFQYCGADSDCVKAVNGCCDCANGGVDVAVSKDKLEAFRARFDCNMTSCPKQNNQQCGTGVISCKEHKCAYFTLDQLKSPPPIKKR